MQLSGFSIKDHFYNMSILKNRLVKLEQTQKITNFLKKGIFWRQKSFSIKLICQEWHHISVDDFKWTDGDCIYFWRKIEK